MGYLKKFRQAAFLFTLVLVSQPLFSQNASPIIQSSEEAQIIKETLQKIFSSASGSGNQIEIGPLNIQSQASGEKLVKGSISMFGKGNVQLESTFGSNLKPKTLKAGFPDGASLNFNHIDALAGGKLKDFVPAGFPLNAGVVLRNIEFDLDESGYTPSRFSTKLTGNSSWELMGDGSISVSDAGLIFEVNQPTSPQRVISGNLEGRIQIGSTPVNLGAKLSSNKNDLKFSGSIGRVGLQSFLFSVAQKSGIGSILNAVPEFINKLELSELKFNISPLKKEFTATAASSLGSFEVLLKSGSGGQMQALMGFAPPSQFKFSSFSPTLASLDQVNLSGTAFIISSFPGDVGSELTLLSGSAGKKLKVVEGLNIFSRIKLGNELSNFLKVSDLDLYGSIDKTLTNVSFLAAFNFNDLKLGTDIYLRQVGLGMHMAASKLQFELTGMMEAIISGDMLRFNTGFRFSVTDVDLTAFFYMEAVKKANAQLVMASKNNHGESEPPEWTDPFGIRGVGIIKLGAQVGFSPKSPIFLSTLGFEADARLGTVANRSKHLKGRFATNISISRPQSSLLDIQMQNMTIIGFIEAFKENHGISGELRKWLDWGLEKAYLRVVPESQDFLGRRYERGIAGGGVLKMAGLTAQCDFAFNEKGIAFSGAIDPIEFKSGSFTWFSLKGFKESNRAMIDLKLDADPSIRIDGSITVLGITNNTFVKMDKTGVEFQLEGNVMNGALKAGIHVKAQQLSPTGGFYAKAYFKNDLQTAISNELVSFIKRESAKAQRAYTDAQNKLNEAKSKNAFEQFFIDLCRGSVTALKEIDRGMAIAGQYVAKGVLDQSINIKEISFEGNLNSMQGSVSAKIDMIIAGQSIQQYATISLNVSSLSDAAKLIADQIDDVVINAFETVGSEIARGFDGFVREADNFFSNMGSGFVKLGKEFEKGGIAAVNWIEGAAMTIYNWGDETFNGRKVEAPAQGNAPDMIAYYVSTYKVTINSIRVTQVPKTTTLGITSYPDGNELEIFGSITIIPNGRIWTNTNSNKYGFNLRQGDAWTIALNSSRNVGHAKYFYVDDRNISQSSVLIYTHLYDNDDQNIFTEAFVQNEEMRGSRTVPFSSIPPGSSQTFELPVSRDGHGVTVTFSVQRVPKISDDEMRNAVASRNTEQTIRRGGNPFIPGLINTAVRNNDINTIRILNKYGVVPDAGDLNAAITYAPGTVQTLIDLGAIPGNNELLQAISLKNKNLVNLIVSRGVPANRSHVIKALEINDRDMAILFLQKGVPVNSQDLQMAIQRQDDALVKLMLNNGAMPTQDMVVSTLKSNRMDLLTSLVKHITPDHNCLQEAANLNHQAAFQMLINTGGTLKNNGPVNTAIDKGNADILSMAIRNGGDVNQALSYALQKNNLNLAIICLDNKANPSLAVSHAVSNNNSQLFTSLITQYNLTGNEALQNAIEGNNTGLAQIAITAGKANPRGFISLAAEKGNADIIRLLVENQADPNMAMMAMINQRNTAMVSYLISKRADARRDEYIQQAVNLNAGDMVQVLLNHGANVNAGMTAAMKALNAGMIRLLLDKGADPRPHLVIAVNAGKADITGMLLDKGAIPDHGMPAAVNKNSTEIVKLLLDKGANPQGYIQIPVKNNNIQMVQLLLQKGANPNPGMPVAVTDNHTPIVKLLLDAGAGFEGFIATPSARGNHEMVKLLLDKNADPQPGILPALQNNHTTVIKLLISHGADGNEHLALPARFGNLEIVNLLLAKGSNPELGIKAAVENGHHAVADALIKAGAKGDKREYLDVAVVKNYHQLVPVLVSAGGKVDSSIVDANGKTYLHLASNRDNNLDMVKVLLAAKSSVFARDKDGNTPLHLAVDEGRDDIETVRLLLEAGSDPCAVNNRGRNIFKEARGTKVKRLIKEFGGSRKCAED